MSSGNEFASSESIISVSYNTVNINLYHHATNTVAVSNTPMENIIQLIGNMPENVRRALMEPIIHGNVDLMSAYYRIQDSQGAAEMTISVEDFLRFTAGDIKGGQTDIPQRLLDALMQIANETENYSSINICLEERQSEFTPPVPDSSPPDRRNVVADGDHVYNSDFKNSCCFYFHPNKKYRFLVFPGIMLLGLIVVTTIALVVFGKVLNNVPDAPLDQHDSNATTSAELNTTTSTVSTSMITTSMPTTVLSPETITIAAIKTEPATPPTTIETSTFTMPANNTVAKEITNITTTEFLSTYVPESSSTSIYQSTATSDQTFGGITETEAPNICNSLQQNCTKRWSHRGLSVELIDRFQLFPSTLISGYGRISQNALREYELLYHSPEVPNRPCLGTEDLSGTYCTNTVNFAGTTISVTEVFNNKTIEMDSRCACLRVHIFGSGKKYIDCEMVGYDQNNFSLQPKKEQIIGYCRTFNNESQTFDTHFHFPAEWAMPWHITARNVSSSPYIWQFGGVYFWVQQSCGVEFFREEEAEIPAQNNSCHIYLAIFSEQSRQAIKIDVQWNKLEKAVGVDRKHFVVLLSESDSKRKKAMVCTIGKTPHKTSLLFDEHNDVTIIEESYETIAIGVLPDHEILDVSAFYNDNGLFIRSSFIQVMEVSLSEEQLSSFLSSEAKIKGMTFIREHLYTLWCDKKCQLLVFALSYKEIDPWNGE